jgi:cation:H+ antiporter
LWPGLDQGEGSEHQRHGLRQSGRPLAAYCPKLEASLELETAVPLLLVSLAVILIAAELFTNGVEWVGLRLGLGHGAVGSLLAAFGTAMPETMIPIIAIIFVGGANSEDVGIGAILGAPFLLSTAAFAVAGSGLLLFQRRRPSGKTMTFDPAAIRRDFSFFFVVYLVGIGCSFLPYHGLKIGVACLSLGVYAYYVVRTLSNSGEAGEEEEMEALRFSSLVGRIGPPATAMAWFQVAVALGLIIGAAYLFVTEIDRVSDTLSIPPLVLALVIAPLATELPETFNSIIWIRESKDTLAMGNISGAMVFQSSIPVSIGVLFTTWKLTTTALVSASIALVSTGSVFFNLRRHGNVSAPVLVRAGVLWLAFVIFVVARSTL